MGRVFLHLIPAITIGFVLQIILHEIGHLIGGLLTGWRFLYIHLYTLVLSRDNNGLKIMRVNDISFKCIMYPSSVNNRALLYTMGGCIINLITSILGLLVIISLPMPPVLWLYVWCFIAFGVGLLFMNGMASINRVCNDKACYNLLKSDKQSMHCHNAQLIMARYLLKGITFGQIGEEVICLSPDIVKNDIQAYQAVLEYYYYLDVKNYLKVGQALNKIRVKDNISKEVLSIIELEHIYMQLLVAFVLFDSGHNKVSISNLEENINKHSKNGDIHTLRVKAAYEAYVQLNDGSSKRAIELLEMSIENMKNLNCVYEGEKIFCINQLNEVVRIIKDYKNSNDCTMTMVCEE